MARKTHPGFGYVAGIACLIVAIGFAAHAIYNYHDWVKVEASTQDLNCQTESTSGSTGIGPYRHKKTETVSICDVQINYEYNGKVYTDTLHDIDQTNGKKITRYIDPSNPQNSDDISWEFVIILAFGVMGLVNIITGYFGVKEERKRKKE
jgi:hypothetical protein